MHSMHESNKNLRKESVQTGLVLSNILSMSVFACPETGLTLNNAQRTAENFFCGAFCGRIKGATSSHLPPPSLFLWCLIAPTFPPPCLSLLTAFEVCTSNALFLLLVYLTFLKGTLMLWHLGKNAFTNRFPFLWELYFNVTLALCLFLLKSERWPYRAKWTRDLGTGCCLQ